MQEAMPSNLLDAVILEPNQSAQACVIWLHGLGADGHDFAGVLPELGLPESHAIRFVFPHAPMQAVTINGGAVMRSWYDIRSMDFLGDVDQAGIQASADHVEGFIEQQVQAGIPLNKIVVAGFSQGGLIALQVGLTQHRDLAGVLALSTYTPNAHTFSAENDFPVLMMHGEHDPVIPLSVAELSYQALLQQGLEVVWKDYPMAHQVNMQQLKEIGAWLQACLA